VLDRVGVCAVVSASVGEGGKMLDGLLPCYSPHLNLMETVWRRVKGGLMPRRYYEDVASLRAAVVAGLKQLGGEELKI
jgi:hypothetical protein